MHSLRAKIRAAYAALALIIGGISLFAYLDLAYVDYQIGLGETVARLKAGALEMRGFEKNYLLYHQAKDLEAARDRARAIEALLLRDPEAFLPVIGEVGIRTLRENLERYDRLLGELREGDEAQEPAIREAGHAVSTAAAAMAAREREVLRESIVDSRNALLVSIAIIVLLSVWLGRALARAVVDPLERLKRELKPIAEGRFERLTAQFDEQEFASVAQAINRMLGELDDRRRQLLHSEKLASLGVLVSGVAHELNNPLSNISTSAQLLAEELEDPTPDAEMQREWLGQIDEQTERARDIVRALLDFSRDNPFRMAPTPLRRIVEKSVALLRVPLRGRLEVALEVPAELTVVADRQRLQQVFINLIANAADAVAESGEGRGRLTVGAEATRRRELHFPPEAYLFGNNRCGVDDDTPVTRITVEDDGPGIPPEILPKVFDPFFTTKETGHGMGLGLYVVMEIVEDHEGCIAVESDGGHGARFTLLLPGERSAEEMA